MKISSIPPPELRAQMKTWLLETLGCENLDNNQNQMPTVVHVFYNGRNCVLQPAGWRLYTADTIYVGGRSSSEVEPLQKLAILVAIAGWARCGDDRVVIDAVTRAFGREVIGGYQQILDGLAISREPIQRLAISMTGTQIAAEYADDEGFLTAKGEPFVVPNDNSFMVIETAEAQPVPSEAATGAAQHA